MMHFPFHSILLAAGLLISPLLAHAEGWTLESAKSAFEHVKAGDNHVCIMHDGWHIAFLSHDTKQIAAVLITENEDADDHEYDLTDTVSRVAELVGMDSPESMEFDSDGPETSLLVDKSLLDEFAEDTEHVFSGSPVEAMAYLLNDEYFFIEKVLPNGFMHWKTVKKSGVELMMPVGVEKLSAIEVTGRQQMNEYAAEVLAEKLGLGKNTASAASRNALCGQLRCTSIPYMNTKGNVLLARTDRKAVIGKRQAAGQLLASRNSFALSYPGKASDWPQETDGEEEEPDAEEEEEESDDDEEAVDAGADAAESPEPPGQAARDAYIEYLQSL